MNAWAGGAAPCPALFLGNGSPMNAIQETPFSHIWRSLGESMGRPTGVLCISAHWVTDGSKLTVQSNPPTLHDFGGFPADLYRTRYPAPGSPDLARRTAALLGLDDAALSSDWGLDHGSWSVLIHLFPQTDIPVVQLSLDRGRSPSDHVFLAKRLAQLRREQILVLASGNIVHNLGRLSRDEDAPPPAWAIAFDQAVARAAEERRLSDLSRWETLTSDAVLSHPTPEHYWPLLYVLALREEGESLSFPVEGFQHGTISMRAVQVGM